jgi:hypothetical protein
LPPLAMSESACGCWKTVWPISLSEFYDLNEFEVFMKGALAA